MPIDFPPNPSIGLTYSYGGILWTYNGTAWNKTTASGSGNTGATGATGAQGEPGQSSNYYSYKVHTTTQIPPTGAGEIRYNNATQTSSTVLYVDHLDNTGDDIDIFLSLLKQNDNLIIQDANNSNNYQTWRINSAPTVILNDYTSIPVTGITSAGTGTSGFANNHQVLFIVFSSPIATAYVESLRGLTGAIGLTNGNGIGISVSGNTLTLSNTGVLSFNGLTGAVTGVQSLNGFTGSRTITGGTGISVSSSITGITIGLTSLIQGPTGSTGATGATGNNGTNGINGPTGAGYLSLSGQEIEMGSLSVGDSYIILVIAATPPAYSIGQSLIVYDTSVPNSNRYFTGTITDWASATNIVTLTITKIVGSATSTSWILNLIGQEGLQGNTGATGPVGPYVISFNGFTGAVSGVTTGTANTFVALQSFTTGISASGDVTLSGNFSGATGSFSRLLTASAGISAAGGVTFAGTVSSDTGYRISSSPFNTQTGTTYTFVAADNGKIVTFNNGSTITVTVPTGLPVGFNCTGIQLGAGQVGFTAASGVTLNAYASGLKIAGQHGSAALISYTSNVYNLSGTLTI